jgi:hypothetical protein
MGIDINDPGFWQKGYDLAGALVQELQKTLQG